MALCCTALHRDSSCGFLGDLPPLAMVLGTVPWGSLLGGGGCRGTLGCHQLSHTAILCTVCSYPRCDCARLGRAIHMVSAVQRHVDRLGRLMRTLESSMETKKKASAESCTEQNKPLELCRLGAGGLESSFAAKDESGSVALQLNPNTGILGCAIRSAASRARGAVLPLFGLVKPQLLSCSWAGAQKYCCAGTDPAALSARRASRGGGKGGLRNQRASFQVEAGVMSLLPIAVGKRHVGWI